MSDINKGAYLVLGLGKSGFATAAFLKEQGISFFVHDDQEKGRTEATNKGYALFNNTQWDKISRVITGPGIPFSHPFPHPFIEEASKRNIPIITDCTLLQEYAPTARYIAITGTNGKSTTTALIAHVLNQNGVNAGLGGNIGVAALSLSLTHDIYVLELSSFQLERSPHFKVDVAVWTNITEDHMEQHGTMNDYVAAKERMLKNAHHVVISSDDTWSLNVSTKHSKAITVSTKVALPEELSPLLNHPTLKGEHNLQNMLLAFHALSCFGLKSDTIISSILSFNGLDHRQEFVSRDAHITFINDSKATGAAATEHALRAYDNIFWLVGGKDKSDGIDPLTPYFPKINKAYVFGAAKNRFAKTLHDAGVPCEMSETLCEALDKAHTDAQTSPKEATILLSPACASYDQFTDFEARGEHFKEKVHKLLSHTPNAALKKA